MDQEPSALSELRELGLTIDIQEEAAARIQANLLIVYGRFAQRAGRSFDLQWKFFGDFLMAVYHAIAKVLVDEHTADETIESTIPRMVHSFYEKKGWVPTNLSEQQVVIVLTGPVSVWKGRVLLKRLKHGLPLTGHGEPINEVERRGRLLAAYKVATGNPPDYRIYNARNSGIHKPQFYSWKNGRLRADSSTCVQFERFLSEMKSPIPRKQKP